MNNITPATATATTVLLCWSSFAQAQDNGFFMGLNTSNDLSEYTLDVPRTAISDTNRFTQHLPENMRFGITTNSCFGLEAGYRWSGGNTNVGGFSWEGSTALYGERCDANITLPLEDIVQTTLSNIRADFLRILNEEMDRNVPEELHGIITYNNVDTQIVDYILNPNEPFPSRSEVNVAFDSLPDIPQAHDELEEIRERTLRLVDTVNDARRLVGDLNALDNSNMGGKMYGAGIRANIQGNYHVSNQTALFLGLDFDAAVRGTFHANPLHNLIPKGELIVPFHGYETTLSMGVNHNLNDDWSLSASFNVPHSEFEVLLDGATLTKDNSPYVELSAEWNDQFRVGVTHRDGRTGINAHFQMNF